MVPRVFAALSLGQLLSLLIAGTGISSQLLVRSYGISAPATQSLTLYVLLLLVFGPQAICVHVLRRDVDRCRCPRRGGAADVTCANSCCADVNTDDDRSVGISVRAALFLVPLGFADALANYLVVLAYRYTSITSVMLLDCVTVPTVMFLAYLPPLRARYSVRQLAGAAVATAGLILLIVSDALDQTKQANGKSGDSSGESGSSKENGNAGLHNPLLGDVLCVAGSCLYAVSNVGQEWFVTRNGRGEGRGAIVLWLAALGLFGTLFCTIELAVLERSELSRANHWPAGAFWAFAGFAACLFTLYATTPMMMRMASATLFNLSLLTSDVFAILASIVFFKHTPSLWYFVAFAIIAGGLVLYSSEGIRAEFKDNDQYAAIVEAVPDADSSAIAEDIASSDDRPESTVPTTSSLRSSDASLKHAAASLKDSRGSPTS